MRLPRSFNLGDHISQKEVEASYKDGILEVRLRKAEEAKPKQIPIK